LAESPSVLLTPREWCARVLTALRQRKAAGQDVAYLEMMLTYFIEVDPRHEEFGELLARFISGPGVAGAADLLQCSWQRGEEPAEPPPLPETLRTLGGLLDDFQTPLARLSLETDSTLVQPLVPLNELALGPVELQQEISARTALRGQVATDDSADAERYERLLRVVGTALATKPAQSYDLIVTPRVVIVEGSAGYFRVFTREELAPPGTAAPGRTQPPGFQAWGLGAGRRAQDGSRLDEQG
jgi:hypothetical protein